MNAIYKQLGKRMREIRKRQDLTLDEFSERTTLDWSFLARIETGKAVPSIMSLVKISKALNVSVADLFADVVPQQTKLLDREIASLVHNLKVSNKVQLIKILKTILSSASAYSKTIKK